MRISTGVIMPAIPFGMEQIARQADNVHLHLPQLDAAHIALRSCLLGKSVASPYHCDLHLLSSCIHRPANLALHLSNHSSARAANTIVIITHDCANLSAFLRHYLDKVHVIPPMVFLTEPTLECVVALRFKADIISRQRIIDKAARLVNEKGMGYLVEAMSMMLKKHPSARMLFTRQHENVLGE